MNIEWQSLLSTLFGGSIAVGMCKYFIGKTIDKIDSIPEKFSEVKSELSSMRVKLDHLERLSVTIQEHDRKIVALESMRKPINRKSDIVCQA